MVSYITNVIVVGLSDRDVNKINDWLREHDTERNQKLNEISMDAAGGTKFFLDRVWAAALNYAPDGLDDFLRSLTWTHGKYAIYEGEDKGFSLGESWNSRD